MKSKKNLTQEGNLYLIKRYRFHCISANLKLKSLVVIFFAIPVVMPRFEIDFTFTDKTDASIHKETIQAETGEKALNELHRKHNYKL